MPKKHNTFIISLPERKYDRLDLLVAQMDNFNFDFTVVEAIKNENGAHGLVLTMQKLLSDCISKGLSHVWILEDDAVFIDHPEIIDKAIAQVPSDFDLLYFGGYLISSVNKLYSKNTFVIPMMYSTHSIYYSMKGMIKLLELIEDTISKGYIGLLDQMIVQGIQTQRNCYCSFPAVMKQRPGYSDIEKKSVNYNRYHEEKFKEMTGHLSLPILP